MIMNNSIRQILYNVCPLLMNVIDNCIMKSYESLKDRNTIAQHEPFECKRFQISMNC